MFCETGNGEEGGEAVHLSIMKYVSLFNHFLYSANVYNMVSMGK